MTTSVHVDTHTYATVHVATSILKGLRQIITAAGLDPAKIIGEWQVLEDGAAAWLRSGHLQALVLEVVDATRPSGDELIGRFDFTIDYGYYPGGDGEFWFDSDSIAFAIRKEGSYPARCDYEIIATLKAGYPSVAGWTSGTLRPTDGLTRRSIGTAVGGGALGAGLTHYTRSTR